MVVYSAYQSQVKQHFKSIPDLIEHHFVAAYKSIDHEVDHELVKEMLQSCQNLGVELVIATTSGKTTVESLLGDISVPVIGKVAKFVQTPDFTMWGKEVTVQHEEHIYRVNIQRGKYYEAIVQDEEENGPIDAFLGDVFSLDLALPFAMGYPIILKKNHYTPKWSETFVREHGDIINDLRELPALCEQIRQRPM